MVGIMFENEDETKIQQMYNDVIIPLLQTDAFINNDVWITQIKKATDQHTYAFMFGIGKKEEKILY